jgi:hypothetical protein
MSGGQINYQTVVAERTSTYVVPAASDGGQQIVRAPEINRGHHVGNARATSDYFGTFTDACIPDPPSLVVADIRWLIDLTVKSRPEGLDIDIGHGWHSILLPILPGESLCARLPLLVPAEAFSSGVTVVAVLSLLPVRTLSEIL